MKSALRAILILAATAGLAAILLVAGCSDDDDSGTNSNDNRDDWTVMVYGAGNYSADTVGGQSMVISSIQEMEKVDTSSTVHIIAMVASGATGGAGRYYEIDLNPTDSGNQISSTMKEDLGAMDMSSHQTLSNFLDWAMTNYPAKQYAVVIDGPGSGWRGCCRDDINGAGTNMSLVDLRTALDQAMAQRGGGKYDVVAFTGGSMGMVEVAYELRSVADYMVGTEFDTSLTGVFGWQTWLDDLVGNPTRDGKAVAQSIVNAAYAAANATSPLTPMHLSAIELDSVANLATRLAVFGDTLAANGGNFWSSIQIVRNASRDARFGSLNVDIKLLAQLTQAHSNLNSITSIVAAADSVERAADAAVILPKSNVSNRATSLAIHFPDTSATYDSTQYAAIDFQATGWTGFLSGYVSKFESQNQITLTINIEPAGAGTVTKVPDQDTYSPGQSVELIAVAGSGYAWDQWTYESDNFGFNPVTLGFESGVTQETITANFVDSAQARVVTLSGTITWTGHTLTNPVLVLLDSTLGTIQGAWALSGGASTDFHVQFLTSEVPSSYIHATDDLDGDLTVFEAGEPYGCYNGDGDQMCDFVQYSNGMSISDIDLQIGVPAAPEGPSPLRLDRSLSLRR